MNVVTQRIDGYEDVDVPEKARLADDHVAKKLGDLY